MRRGIIFLLLLFSSFFVLDKAFSANSDIVINEIGAYPTNTHEWIEIWNKGADPVDLTGWKFWENSTNHGLAASTTDSFVAPGEYAAICQDETQFFLDFPSFGGSVFDSSWSSLSESGEEIGIKDSEGSIVEHFTYISTANYSLERANPFLVDYTVNNWHEQPDGNTLGFVNSNFTSGEPAPTSTPTSTPEDSGESTSSIWVKIKINEIVSDPSEGNEWVELFNPTTSTLNMVGGKICDNRESTSTCKNTAGNLPAGGWLKIDLESASYLNNDGDSVILKNAEEEIVDLIAFSGATAPAKGQSLARRVDGVDTDAGADWTITTNITPIAANIIVAPVIVSSGGGGGSSGSLNTVIQAEISLLYSSSSIVLNEMYPYPDEDEEEFIEIKNTTAGAINLTGWKVGDKAKTYALSGPIGAGEIRNYDKIVTGIALNNSTAEEVRLIGPQGQVFGLLKYDSAKKGLSYSRNASDTWQWTAKITRGAENEFVEPSTIDEVQANTKDEVGLLWRLKYKPFILQGEEILFDASRALDPRGGRINFVWDFAEGKFVNGEIANYVFASSGVHNIFIYATSSAGTIDTKKIKINVYPANEPLGAGVVIGEVAPNESEGVEYIALRNIAPTTTNISNWKIIANDKIYSIPTGTILLAGDSAVYYKEITKIALNNSGGTIELRRDDDVLVDVVNYEKTKTGEKFVRAGNEWQLVKPVVLTEAKTAVKSTAKKTIAKVAGIKIAAPVAGIDGVRELDKGYFVTAEGVVAVVPGIFGTQFFYIVDGSSGVQIYQYKKDFPTLKAGDRIQVQGETAEASGAKRIKIKNKSNIKILSSGQAVSSTEMVIEDLASENAGSLVKVTGEITEIKTSYFFLDNGAGEIKVYLKKGAKIDKTQFKEGELAEVTGIFEMYKTEMQLWPRSQGDIIIIGKSEELLRKEGVPDDKTAGNAAEKYLIATAGGITALILGFLSKVRGVAMQGLAGKARSLIVGLFKKK